MISVHTRDIPYFFHKKNTPKPCDKPQWPIYASMTITTHISFTYMSLSLAFIESKSFFFSISLAVAFLLFWSFFLHVLKLNCRSSPFFLVTCLWIVTVFTLFHFTVFPLHQLVPSRCFVHWYCPTKPPVHQANCLIGASFSLIAKFTFNSLLRVSPKMALFPG